MMCANAMASLEISSAEKLGQRRCPSGRRKDQAAAFVTKIRAAADWELGSQFARLSSTALPRSMPLLRLYKTNQGRSAITRSHCHSRLGLIVVAIRPLATAIVATPPHLARDTSNQ